MKTVRNLSPARSQGSGLRTPIHRRKHKIQRSKSVSSARSNTPSRLTDLIQDNRSMDSFVMSPLQSRKSILSDNTEIGEPRRKSWWKNLGENSRDVIELLEENNIVEPNNIIEELDIEVLSQEKKNYTMDLPESSDSESINSIVIPQRKLFTQKENLPHKKFGEIIGTRETLAKHHKPSNSDNQTVNIATRELFQNKPRSKPIFPAALLNITPNKTIADKTKDFTTVEPKTQVRNIFGNRAQKRKNIFTNFIVSESEDDIPEIQPKVFGFQKKMDARRRGSSSSRGMREPSPTSSITTDLEMDDWKMLPSSTMVENQLEIMMADGTSPKRVRLSKLTEIESEVGSNATKQSNKSVSSKESDKNRKSKTFNKDKAPESHVIEDVDEDLEPNEAPEKSRKSKTFTKEKAPQSASMTTTNKSKIILEDNDEMLDQNRSLNDKERSRKSKTFTKEKVPQSDSMTTRNKSKIILEDNEEMSFQNRSLNDKEKSRKSKTFTKEKVPQSDSMTTRNKSKIILENEEMSFQNTSLNDKEKSRKSKTFIKEKAADLSSNNTKNKDIPSEDEDKMAPNQKAQNKSKSKIIDQNSSIRTRSQSKTNSPNSSQGNEELNTENTDKTLTNKNKSKSPKGKNIESENAVLIPTQENEDDELNFTLSYDDQHEELPEAMQNKSETKTAKSMTQLENSINISKKTESNKIVDESAELEESSHQKSSHSVKTGNSSLTKNAKTEEREMEPNRKQTDLPNDVSNKANSKHEGIEIAENKCAVQDKIQEKISQHIDGLKANNEQLENDDVDMNISEPQIESEVDKSLEQEVDKIDQNESENIENGSDNEELQQSLEAQDQTNPDNVSQDIEDDVDGNNESQEVQDESDEVEENESQDQNESLEIDNEENEEQNESLAIENEEEDEEQIEENEQDSSLEKEDESQEVNESLEIENEQNDSQEQNETEIEEGNEHNMSQEAEEEHNESEVEDQESEVIADAQDDVNDSDDDDNNEVESDRNDDETGENEEIGTPNVSHDTTGRNRKKNESPEAILHDSKNHLDSFAVQGRNTSVRKTELIKSMHIRPSLASVRESNDFSDGSRNSSNGSGWDSHRTTRKTLRQTFGRDFTPRKSLRALVMEKSAKRQTQHNDIASVTTKFPQANSTELPETSNRFEDDNDENEETNHEVSLRTRQTTLDAYLQEIKKKNAESRLMMEEAVRSSLTAAPKYNLFKVPARPIARRVTKPTTNTKQTKSALLFGQLPPEIVEDFKYKPPKRFQPSNASWITKRLYKHLESKLEVKYDYKARIRAEKLVENMYYFAKDLRRRDVASSDAVDVLKREMARLDIVKTHFEFYDFVRQFMPREVRVKVIPDVVNNISLPKHGVFSDIL